MLPGRALPRRPELRQAPGRLLKAAVLAQLEGRAGRVAPRPQRVRAEHGERWHEVRAQFWGRGLRPCRRPHLRLSAVEFQPEGFQEPPTDRQELKRYKESLRNRMYELGRLAVSFRMAGEEPVERLEVKIAVVKASLGLTLPTAAQLADMRGKYERAKDKLKATKAWINQLAE